MNQRDFSGQALARLAGLLLEWGVGEVIRPTLVLKRSPAMKIICLLPLLLISMVFPILVLAVESAPDALRVTMLEVPGGQDVPSPVVESVADTRSVSRPEGPGSQELSPPVVETPSDKLHVTKLEVPVSQLIPPAVVVDQQLEAQRAGFIEFARGRVGDINKNHILSRERMQIKKGTDGLYRALFHEVDDQSLSIQLSRSTTRGIPYVAVLSYRELVYTATCTTPSACQQGPFQPIEVIPNRHIFVYNSGSWQ